jgi:hypothetical protein
MEMTPSEVSSANDVHSRFEQWLNADDSSESEAEVAVEEENEQENGDAAIEQDEASEETEVSQEEAEESKEAENSEDDFETIDINGKNIRVPKEVATEVSALKRNLVADYTRKTQEIAEIRKQALELNEQNMQRIAFEQQNVNLLSQMQSLESQLKNYENVDWAALAEQDISLYSKHKEIRDDLRGNLQNVKDELGKRYQFTQQLDAKAQQEAMQQTVNLVKQAVPDYFEKYDNEVIVAAENLATKYGLKLDQNALRTLSRDPLVVLGLVELVKYQQKDASLQAKRSEIGKKMEAVPKKMQKSISGKQSNQNQSRESKIKALLKAGRIRDAAEL